MEEPPSADLDARRPEVSVLSGLVCPVWAAEERRGAGLSSGVWVSGNAHLRLL